MLLRDVARVELGPDERRGITELNGEGEVASGIVLQRFGVNALDVIENVKKRFKEIASSLPKSVEIVPVYDRSNLIYSAIDTLKHTLFEESVVVALVCIVFLLHVRSALVAILMLPVGVLMAFGAMKLLGLGSNIMSLGGIAIAIGAMVDAAIVMIENAHKHLERAEPGKSRIDILIEAAAHPKVIGIGESGLDYYYDHSDRDRQKASFRAHIEASRETGLPIIIHTRDAEDDTFAILSEEMGKGAFPALIHCFTASADFGTKVLDLGLYISISGIVTFKNAKDLQAAAAIVPEDRLLVETDAPFLAPVPHRGKTGEPSFVVDTTAFLAQLRGTDAEQLSKATADNFFRLFTKAVPGTAA